MLQTSVDVTTLCTLGDILTHNPMHLISLIKHVEWCLVSFGNPLIFNTLDCPTCNQCVGSSNIYRLAGPLSTLLERNCEPDLGLYEQTSPSASPSLSPLPSPAPVPLVPSNAQQFYVNFLQLNIPSFPSPSIGQFFNCLLQYCSAKTTTCFGCGNTLKPNSSISPPSRDLVIISKMARGWTCQGHCTVLSTVYYIYKLFCRAGGVHFLQKSKLCSQLPTSNT